MTTVETTLGPVALGADGVATLTLKMAGKANKINEDLLSGLEASLDALEGWREAEGDRPALVGVLLESGHRDFGVGADLGALVQATGPAPIFEQVMRLHRAFRRLETLGVPVVTVLEGSALGGGYELALATHHLVAVDDPRIQVGLPEVNLGVIPGGGGTQRLSRRIGLQAALQLLAEGKLLRAGKAKAQGLVDAVAATSEAAREAARAWIAANPSAKQPWDLPKMRWPGIRPGSPDATQLFLAGAALLYKKTAGAYPAAEALASVVQDGSRLAFDRALEVEARAFARLAASPQAKAMIRTNFVHREAARKQVGLPQIDADGPWQGFQKVAVLGAGMMGAGLGFVLAKAGYRVVLKDISDEALTSAVIHLSKQITKRLKYLDDDAQRDVLGRITLTTSLHDLEGADLVIEAVFEDLALKHRVLTEVLPLLADDAVVASNTSALPINRLAEVAKDRTRFLGLHFFSPVEVMPLLEIIRGDDTSDDALARCLHLARALGKLPIVVHDGYGFYTTRVFTAYVFEGARLVVEGHDPATIEWAARSAGMAVGPLQVFDEVSLELGRKGLAQALEFDGGMFADAEAMQADPAVRLVLRLVEQGRAGRASGAGFYAYDAKGKRSGLWPGLVEAAAAVREELGLEAAGERVFDGLRGARAGDTVRALGRRLLLVQVAEVARLFGEGIVTSARDADVGAVFGLGFAPNTGGPCSWMDLQGLPSVVAELGELADTHGPRFAPSAWLMAKAEAGGAFYGG